MELKVGMYVKYTRGAINGYVPPRIAKIIDCSDKDLIKIDNGQVILKADILKASYDILDLIEEGDYVNDYKILEIVKGFKVIVDKLELNTRDGNYYLKQFTNNEIKSIVTKEQYENNVYKVEDK